MQLLLQIDTVFVYFFTVGVQRRGARGTWLVTSGLQQVGFVHICQIRTDLSFAVASCMLDSFCQLLSGIMNQGQGRFPPTALDLFQRQIIAADNINVVDHRRCATHTDICISLKVAGPS